jgi:hypothetical protein
MRSQSYENHAHRPTLTVVAGAFLLALLDRTVRDSLTPDQIKRAVKTWVPDFDRT